MNTFIKISGFITFFCLFVFALLFYKERTITFDMSFQEIYLLITHKLVLNLKVGAAIPQMVPLLLQHLKFSLKTILLVYSASYIVFYFLFFLTIAFVLRQNAVALVFLLSTLLLVNDTFYWIQSELPQGLAWLLLYYAYIEKKGCGEISRKPLLHFLLILFIQSFHPLLFFPILYVLLFSVYKQYKFDLSRYVWPVGISITGFAIRIWISRFDQYESSKLNLTDMMRQLWPSLHQFIRNIEKDISSNAIYVFVALLFTSAVVIYFWKRQKPGPIIAMVLAGIFLIAYLTAKKLAMLLPSVAMELHFAGSDYLIYWLVLGVTLVFLGLKKRFVPLALLVLFTFGYFLMICIEGHSADKFYLENMMLPAGIFVLLPFVWLLVNIPFRYRGLFIPLLLGIIVTRLVFVFNSHSLYTSRLDWYQQRFIEMDKTGNQRLMLTDKNISMDTLVMTWASGYESLILSSIDGPTHSKSIVIDNDLTQYKPFLAADTLTLAKWGVWSAKDLPQRYFLMRPGHY